MSLQVTRNPNLTYTPKKNNSTANDVQNKFGKNWWTGLPPEDCPGFDRVKKYLRALPLLNLQICTRQDVLDYFDNTWTLTELLFQSLRKESTFVRSPYHQLRHPMMFYYGHPAVLFVNKLRVAGLLTEPIDLYLEKVLETGVDEMSWDDLSKNQMEWPSVEAVHGYRKKVYQLIRNLILNNADLERKAGQPLLRDSALWALWMGFEHEKIHFETSSVLIRELPIEEVETPQYWAPLAPHKTGVIHPKVGRDYPENHWKKESAQDVHIGKPSDTPSYGWDNEYGEKKLHIQPFQYTERQISNGEFLEFVLQGGYLRDEYWTEEGLLWRKFRNTKRPTFWAASGPEGSHEYKLRTLFEFIDMPWDWPVEVNFHEAKAFCHWRQKKDGTALKYRLLTEGEFQALTPQREDPVLQKKNYRETSLEPTGLENFNFKYGSPTAVGSELYGNVWHWLEDQFHPLSGFEVHPYYDDFSTPCFDGKHQMIRGGSFISCGHEASQWARFHFRPHFYQHSGFRMAATLDGSADNGAVRLKADSIYVHSRRQNALAQIEENPEWWKKAHQPMDLAPEEFSQLLAVTQKILSQHLQKVKEYPPAGNVFDPRINSVPNDFIAPFQSTKSFPEVGGEFEALLKFVVEEMAPLSQWPGHPRFAAYVAGSGNLVSAIAQMVSLILNPFTGHFMMAPGLVSLEAEALRWFLNLIGYDEKAGGYFTSGSSLATLHAMSIARQALLQGQNDFSLVTAYTSIESHHSVAKAWSLMGYKPENLRFISTHPKTLAMDDEDLKKHLQKDIRDGFKPLLLVGTAGTTNTGAIDPLKELAAVAEEFGLWYHVDGAYGLPFMLVDEVRGKFEGIALADSVAFDLHKVMSLPYGTGALAVRNKAHFKIHYGGASSYMPPQIFDNGDDFRVDYADLTPELSRDFRGLRAWLPFKLFGVGPFKLNLLEKLELSQYASAELKKIKGIEILAEPLLSIQAFRLKETGRDADQLTRKLLEEINASKVLFLSGCKVQGQYAIRLSFVGYQLHFQQVEEFIKTLPGFIEKVLNEDATTH